MPFNLPSLEVLSHSRRTIQEDDVPLSDYAFGLVIQLVDPVLAYISSTRELPRVVDDEEGGIRMTWQRHGKQLRVVLPSSPSGAHYIYWEMASEYGACKNFTEVTLRERLSWLQNERG